MLHARELNVIAVISNPLRYQSRRRLFNEFLMRMHASGATVWVAECVFGDRDAQCIDPKNEYHFEFRCDHELWVKESLINAIAAKMPWNIKYLGWCDGDIDFVKPDWATETVHALQHHNVVQPFSHVVDLGQDDEIMETHSGFAYQYKRGLYKHGAHYGSVQHPGYSWFWRRGAWAGVGGMIDIGICGAGDHHMATGLINDIHMSYPRNIHPNYAKICQQWQQRAKECVNGNIGYVPGTILHHFHGLKHNRYYQSRWDILTRNQYDPEVDITRDVQRIVHLRGNKPRLRDDLQAYFRSRREDSRA